MTEPVLYVGKEKENLELCNLPGHVPQKSVILLSYSSEKPMKFSIKNMD